MPKIKLSDAAADKATLSDDKQELVIWDTEIVGFGLRLRRGAKTWIFAYRPRGVGRSGNTKRLKLGTAGSIPASEARQLAKVAAGQVAAGNDPLLKQQDAKVSEEARLARLLDQYETDLERRSYVNSKVVVSGLRTKMKRHLTKDIRDLKGSDYAAIIEELVRDGRPGAAQDFRSRVRAFLTWCVVKVQVLPANPLAGFRQERATRVDRVARSQHGRALSDAELVKVWNAADASTNFGRLIRFYILTGCRRGEGGGLTWAMVDRSAQILDLPPTFTKQARGHKVPIADQLAALLKRCPVDARSDLVFASPRSGTKVSGWTQHMERFTKASGVQFGLHDLRRTFRTGLSRLRVDPDTAELALGHARGDLEQIYNRDTAIAELRKAFVLWADDVEKIVKEAQASDAGVFG